MCLIIQIMIIIMIGFALNDSLNIAKEGDSSVKTIEHYAECN